MNGTNYEVPHCGALVLIKLKPNLIKIYHEIKPEFGSYITLQNEINIHDFRLLDVFHR